MPEWPARYMFRDPKCAGTLCHRESGTLAELAQALAMDQRCHVWVDGSERLRLVRAEDSFPRKQFPHYRIALFYIHASEATVRRRVETRAARGGGGEESRYIPEDVLAASLAAPALTLRALTPHVDFVARITNESNDDPELEALEAVDSSGDWGRDLAALRWVVHLQWFARGGVGAVAGFSVDDDPEATPPRPRPASPRAEVSALKLQAENDRRTIDGFETASRGRVLARRGAEGEERASRLCVETIRTSRRWRLAGSRRGGDRARVRGPSSGSSRRSERSRRGPRRAFAARGRRRRRSCDGTPPLSRAARVPRTGGYSAWEPSDTHMSPPSRRPWRVCGAGRGRRSHYSASPRLRRDVAPVAAAPDSGWRQPQTQSRTPRPRRRRARVRPAAAHPSINDGRRRHDRSPRRPSPTWNYPSPTRSAPYDSSSPSRRRWERRCP